MAPHARQSFANGTMALVLGCAGASPEPATPCSFTAEKTTLESVSVSVKSLRFELGLKEVPARVELTEGHRDARIEVLAPLRFVATAPRGQLPLRVVTVTDVYDGRIRLGAGAVPAWRDVRGGSMLVSLESLLGVAVKQPIAIACNRLGLSDGLSTSQTPAPALADGKRIGLGWDFVPFYRTPEEADPLDIQYAGAYAVKDVRPGWLNLAATWEDGSKIEGWTPNRPISAQYETFDGWAGGHWGGVRGGRSDGPALIEMTLHAGAAVTASPAGPVWAVVMSDIQVRVVPSRSDDWLQVAAVPGLPWPPGSFEHEHLWVRARDLSPGG